MDKAKKHIEIKYSEAINEKLVEYYNSEFKDCSFMEQIQFQELMLNDLGYKVSYKKITTQDGKDITVQDFLEDLQRKFEENEEFKIDINTCMHFDKYIDYDKTNITVKAFLDINKENREYLKKLHHCDKVIYVSNIMVADLRDITWLKEQENIEIREIGNKKLDITADELVKRHELFKKYLGQNGISQDWCDDEYSYFIKECYEINSEEDFDNLKKIENWFENSYVEKGEINLLINASNIDNQDKVKKLLETGNYTAKAVIHGKSITLKEIENIRALETAGVKVEFKDKEYDLNVDTIAEIEDELIEKFNITQVRIGSNENSNELPLSISRYKALKNILENIVKDIDVNKPEKEKFKVVYTKLAHMLTYDDEAVKDETEYAKDNKRKCRNLENGLLLGKCVCAGYAEILKQTLSLVGIESHYISSKSDEKGTSHAYNIVKIDENWYNADLTWDYEYIRNNISPEYCLKSDKDFRQTRSNDVVHHTPEEEKEEYKCSKSSINIYPEFNKNILFKKTKMLLDRAREVGLKKIMSNIGKMIKEKLTRNAEALLDIAAEDTLKEDNFKKGLKSGAPTYTEQAKFVKEAETNKSKEKTDTDERTI